MRKKDKYKLFMMMNNKKQIKQTTKQSVLITNECVDARIKSYPRHYSISWI